MAHPWQDPLDALIVDTVKTAATIGNIYDEYSRHLDFINRCRDAALTPGHDLEDPKLRIIRSYQQQ